MSSSKVLKLVGCIVGVSICLGLCVYIQKTQKKVKQTLYEIQREYNNSRHDLLDMKEVRHYVLASEEYPTPRELNPKQDVCILRIHDGACLSCYTDNLIYFFKEMDANKLDFFVLGSYSTFKQFQAELTGIASVDTLNSMNRFDLFCLPADTLNKPYLFMNKRGKAQHVYAFEKGEVGTISQYIQMLKRLKE